MVLSTPFVISCIDDDATRLGSTKAALEAVAPSVKIRLHTSPKDFRDWEVSSARVPLSLIVTDVFFDDTKQKDHVRDVLRIFEEYLPSIYNDVVRAVAEQTPSVPPIFAYSKYLGWGPFGVGQFNDRELQVFRGAIAALERHTKLDTLGDIGNQMVARTISPEQAITKILESMGVLKVFSKIPNYQPGETELLTAVNALVLANSDAP
ncbi:MAG: hypothetical protein ACYCVE_06015 [Gemmatimonadaceae bacterium]